VAHRIASVVIAGAVTAVPQPESVDLIARITSVALTLPIAGTEPYLSENGWVIDGKRISQPKVALLRRAKQARNWTGHPKDIAAIVVSLGPKQNFGAFLRTARSLKKMGLCLIFVKDGETAVGSKYRDVPGLRIC
jgi:hypothetical protein